MEKGCRAADKGPVMMPVLCLFLWIFLLFGVAFRLMPDQSFFPLLSGITARLDAVAGELKAGIPIREAAEAFFDGGFSNAAAD